MARRSDNMLEALQASSAESVDPRSAGKGQEIPGTPVGGAAGESAGPFAVGPGSGGASTNGQSNPGPPLVTGGLTLPMGPVGFLVLQIALVVLAFMAGQANPRVGAVHAGAPADSSGAGEGLPGDPGDGMDAQASGVVDVGGGTPTVDRNTAVGDSGASGLRGQRRPGDGTRLRSPGTPPETGPESATQAIPESPADRAFADPRNTFTVLVFTADDSEFGRERAQENYSHLLSKGLDAITPRQRGGWVYLYVGAYPSKAAANQAMTQVALISGPNGSGTPYASAGVRNIPR